MKRTKQSKSVIFFILVTLLPLLKIFLLGEHAGGEQQKYIKLYFWLQFLVPIIDLGFYWTYIRKKIEEGYEVKAVYGLSSYGLLLSIIFLGFDPLFFLVVLLATFTALYNFRLQILKIDGDSDNYYLMRMSKIALDLFFLLMLFSLLSLNVGLLLLGEIFSVLLVIFFSSQHQSSGRLFFFGHARLFSLDYLYTILKVLRANIARLIIPFVFIGQGLEAILFSVLFYELVAQYLLIEKLKDLLDGKLNVIALLLLYFISLPFQYFGILHASYAMSWDFDSLEVLIVILGGGARIFSIYTLNAIKRKAFDVLVYLNSVIVLFAVVEIYSFHKLFPVESAASVSLLVFYGVEALIGLCLIVWLEKSNVSKRMQDDR